MTQTLTFPAPAKVNLFLHVTGRRDDGYHHIETVMAPLAFGDTVTVTVTDDGNITRQTLPNSPLDNVPEDADLTVRAARLLQTAAGVSQGVSLRVDKKVPLGSGLGGGSSDAATVLLALNRLWGANLSREKLAALAQTLGADVPFFIGGTPAFATGIGERLTPVSLPPSWVALVFPNVFVPTSSIFSAKNLTRATASEKIAAFAPFDGKNDLEAVAKNLHPAIETALLHLKRRALHARMSGSGSAVFALCDSPNVARDAISDVPSPFFGCVTRVLKRHPLIEWGFR